MNLLDSVERDGRSMRDDEDGRLWKTEEDRVVPLLTLLSCSEDRMRQQPMAG